MTAETARLPELRDLWITAASSRDGSGREARPVQYNLALAARDVELDFATGIETLEPFGVASPEPVFRLGPLRLVAEPRRFGAGHLELRAVDADGESCEIVGWKWAGRPEPWSGEFEILAALEVDRWTRPARARLRLLEARPASGSPP
jgi:hypothetical protein